MINALELSKMKDRRADKVKEIIRLEDEICELQHKVIVLNTIEFCETTLQAKLIDYASRDIDPTITIYMKDSRYDRLHNYLLDIQVGTNTIKTLDDKVFREYLQNAGFVITDGGRVTYTKDNFPWSKGCLQLMISLPKGVDK